MIKCTGRTAYGRDGTMLTTRVWTRWLGRSLHRNDSIPFPVHHIQRYMRLLFSCSVMSNSFAAPWTCFWAHFIFTPLAGQPTAKMFKYVSPDSPRHLFLLGEARGSDCGHILGMRNKRGASLIRHIWGAVGPSWDFTADVIGAAGSTGEAGTAGIAAVAGAAGVTGVSGVLRHAGITGVAAVTPAAGVTGEAGPARVVAVTGVIGGSGAAVIMGVASGGG